MIVDLRGKHSRLRTIPVPTWVKLVVDLWLEPPASRGPAPAFLEPPGQITGAADPQAVLAVVAQYGEQLGRGCAARSAPHLRQTLPQRGGDLEQIQLLLGHASIQTTERYLGTRQNLAEALNDRLGLAWKDPA